MHVNGWAAAFLVVIGVVLPFLAIQTNRRLAGRPLPMPRPVFYWQTIFFQLFVYAFALVAAATNDIRLRLVPFHPLRAGAAALTLLVVALAVLFVHWRFRSPESRARLLDLLPQTTSEISPYLLLCAVAAVAEEVAYRGTAYRLLFAFGLPMEAAVAVVAAVFALGHMIQGWKSVGVIFVFAVAFHAVVIYGGALLPAIAVHFAYDAIAGLVLPRLRR